MAPLPPIVAGAPRGPLPTKRQLKVLRYIERFTASAGYPPSRREVALYFGVTHNAITCHINLLTRKGYLIRDAPTRPGQGRSRTLRSTRMIRSALQEHPTHTIEWLVPPEHPGRLGAP